MTTVNMVFNCYFSRRFRSEFVYVPSSMKYPMVDISSAKDVPSRVEAMRNNLRQWANTKQAPRSEGQTVDDEPLARGPCG